MPARLDFCQLFEFLAPSLAQRNREKLRDSPQAEKPAAVDQSILVADLSAARQTCSSAHSRERIHFRKSVITSRG
jgi:hypothetical protein